MKHMLLVVFTALISLPTAHAQYRGGSNDGASTLKTQDPQNALPEIYHGSGNDADPDDGYSRISIADQNATPNIYNGGSDDGASFLQAKGFQNTTPEIYGGGSNDGVASISISAQNPSPGIYKGGLNDGVASAFVSDINKTPPIYLGGSNDGAAMDEPRTPQNELPDIYNGSGNDSDPDDGYDFTVSLSQNPTEPPVIRNEARTAALLQLSGEWFNDDAVLGWTAIDKDLHHFELERSEDAGAHFSSIVSVDPSTQAGQADYRYTDVKAYNLPADYLLYRLKCIDKSSAFKYSAVVRLSKDKTAPVIFAYPNPTSGRFTLSMLNVRDLSGYTYVLSGADGKIIQRGDIKEASTSFDLSRNASATYHLFLSKDGKPIQHFTILLTQ